MESRAKFLGHPIHPMLIVIPLGLFVTAVIFDLLYLATGNSLFPVVAFWDIAIGILGGLLAALFGFWDWLHIPAGTRAKAIGLYHGLGNVVVVLLFTLSWFLRRDNPNYAPATLDMVLTYLGIGLGAVTAWLGGELVDRLGIGVDPEAHPDAPSSLSGEPAGGRASTRR